MTYREAGVDIEAGDALVEAIKPLAARTHRPGVLAGIGGFRGVVGDPPGPGRRAARGLWPRRAGAALVGGETAEMPGMYAAGDYDLAGFAVGVVEKTMIIDGSRIGPNDTIIGVASSGPHSNGYSLIRRILKARKAKLDQAFDGPTP